MRFEKISYDAFCKELFRFGPYMMDRDECEKAYQRIRLPERGTERSAGYDFVTPCGIFLLPNKNIIIPSGIKCYFSEDEAKNWHLKLYPRSSLGIKKNVILSNGTGIIDADYYNNPDNEGDILISLYNFGSMGIRICSGDKVMQGIFEAYAVTENDIASGSRTGGLGSTGR